MKVPKMTAKPLLVRVGDVFGSRGYEILVVGFDESSAKARCWRVDGHGNARVSTIQEARLQDEYERQGTRGQARIHRAFAKWRKSQEANNG